MAGRRSGELSKSKSKPGRPCYDLLPEEQVDYFLVLDFEGVNNKYHGGPDIMEIIEFPVLKVNAQTLETESIFHSYVQPTIHTQLNPVCTEITGITQAMVMGQPTLPEVLKLLDDWMKAERLLEEGITTCFVTCGDWDLKTGLPTQCTYQKIDCPEYLRKWVNIKDIFMKLTGTKGFSMKTMLRDLHLELEGRHHSGIDDSKNIAKILKTLAGRDPTKLGQGFVQPKVLNVVNTTRAVMGMQSRGLQHAWLGVLLAVVGGLFCHGLYFLLKRYLVRQVCGRLFRGRRKNRHVGEKEDARSLSDGDVAEISVKLVSLAVALLSSTVGVVILWETRHDVLHSRCSIIPPYVYLIAWYFVYDLYAMFESYCLRKNLLEVRLLARVWIFTRQKWPFVLHHAAILLGLPIGINADLRLGLGDFYIGCFLIREFSTPFLQTAQILKLLDLHRTVFYKLNGVFLLVTFFIVRLLNTPLSFLAYAAQYHSWDVVAAVKAMKPICHICLILEYVLQVYWYSAIVKLAHSAVKHPKVTKLE